MALGWMVMIGVLLLMSTIAVVGWVWVDRVSDRIVQQAVNEWRQRIQRDFY